MNTREEALRRSEAGAEYQRSQTCACGAERIKEVAEEIWDSATNAVCQTLQEAKMCNCPDGRCFAAEVRLDSATLRCAVLDLAASPPPPVSDPSTIDLRNLFSEEDLRRMGMQAAMSRFARAAIASPLAAPTLPVEELRKVLEAILADFGYRSNGSIKMAADLLAKLSPQEMCPTCHGTGAGENMTPLGCKSCSGTGRVPEEGGA